MANGPLFFLLLIVVLFARILILRENRRAIFWATTLCVQLMPFCFKYMVVSRNEIVGVSSNSWGFSYTVILGFVLLVWNALNQKKVFGFSLDEMRYFSFAGFIALLSCVNSANLDRAGGFVFFFAFICSFLFWNQSRRHDLESVFLGYYDGIIVAVAIEFFLSMCYPVLGLSQFATLFSSSAGEWGTRLGSRSASAVGTFGHPGQLALFSGMTACFLFACILYDYRTRRSSLGLAAAISIIVLTQSRTSVVGCACVLIFMYLVVRASQGRKIHIFGISICFVICMILLYLTPLGDMFFKSDVSDMAMARMTHIEMALEMFYDHPLLGVGVNSHLKYLAANFSSIQSSMSLDADGFYSENPIHNIHLIVLAEAGIVGAAVWLVAITSGIYKTMSAIARGIQCSAIVNIANSGFLGAMIFYVIYGFTGHAPFSSIGCLELLVSLLSMSAFLRGSCSLGISNRSKP